MRFDTATANNFLRNRADSVPAMKFNAEKPTALEVTYDELALSEIRDSMLPWMMMSSDVELASLSKQTTKRRGIVNLGFCGYLFG